MENINTIYLPKDLLFLTRQAVELYIKFRFMDYEKLLLENAGEGTIQEVIKLLFNQENDFVFYYDTDDEIEDKSIYQFLVQEEFDLIDDIITINGPHKYLEKYISKSYLINALPLDES